MLTRALSEAVTYPPSLEMLDLPAAAEGGKRKGIGSSILNKMSNSANIQPGNNDQDMSMFTSDSNDVDMSLA